MLSRIEIEQYQLREIFELQERPIRTIRQFFYIDVEPDEEMSKIKTKLDVNWVLFFIYKNSENTKRAIQCTKDVIEYVLGTSNLTVTEIVTNTVYCIYMYKEQIAKVIMIDQEVRSIFNSIREYESQTLLLQFMLLQDYIQYNIHDIEQSVTTYDKQMECIELQTPNKVYKQLEHIFGSDRVSHSSYQIGQLDYIFINATVQDIQGNKAFQSLADNMQLSRIDVFYVGIPNKLVVTYESDRQSVIISNIVSMYDTTIYTNDDVNWQHPIQTVALDMYIRIKQFRDNLGYQHLLLPIKTYIDEILKKWNHSIIDSKLRKGCNTDTFSNQIK